MELTLLTLSTGARLEVRPMPMHVYQQYMGREEARLEKPPPVPMVKQKSVAGHEEDVPAGEGSPEYDAWAEQYDAWSARNNQARADLILRWTGLVFDYGVVRWNLGDGDEWEADPPEGWTFDAALLRAGLEPSDNPRLDYILLKVITKPVDYGRVQAEIQDPGTPVTQEEVESQVAGFWAGEPAAGSPGAGDQAVGLPRGAGGREGVGAYARRLVRAITGRKSGDDRVPEGGSADRAHA